MKAKLNEVGWEMFRHERQLLDTHSTILRFSDTAYDILSEVAQYPAFKDHEMAGFKDRLLLDIAYLNQEPTVKLMEGLHETAFRTSLGYSLYMPESSIGLHSPATLRDFTQVRGQQA